MKYINAKTFYQSYFISFRKLRYVDTCKPCDAISYKSKKQGHENTRFYLTCMHRSLYSVLVE